MTWRLPRSTLGPPLSRRHPGQVPGPLFPQVGRGLSATPAQRQRGRLRPVLTSHSRKGLAWAPAEELAPGTD